MEAIILAGGRGTRLQSIISDLPKPLAPVGKRPFLDILLDKINTCTSINRVILAVGYRSDMIMARYRSKRSYNFTIDFSVETQLLGTGGALKKALNLTTSRDIIVQNGDTFAEIDYRELIESHVRRKALITIVLVKVDDTTGYGSVEIDPRHRILAFREKEKPSGPGYVNTGIYLLRKRLFDPIPDDTVLSMEIEILPNLIKKSAYAYISEGKFIDIGLPATYYQAEEYLKEV